MPRSSKHKSSKHSSRETRECSDSEKDSILKDRKGKDESVVKVSKDSSSSEKRKLDSKDRKDVNGSGNGEYSEEYGSSKRRKERSNGGVGDRWNAGEEDRDEGSRKSKTWGDSKSRRDESLGVYGEGEELKKSSGPHKDSGRKESREGGAEKDRKLKESRSERSVNNEEKRMPEQVFENTDLRGLEELQSLELDNQLEKPMRKSRDDFGSGDKHQDDIGNGHNRRMPSREDNSKDGRQKEEKRKIEKYRNKYRDEMSRENKHGHDRRQDEHPAKDHTSNRSDDKHAREKKDSVDSRKKRIKHPKSDHEQDQDHNRDLDGDQDLECNHGRKQHHDCDHDHDYDYYLDEDHNHDEYRNWNQDLDRVHDQDRDYDRDMSHADERSARSKESGANKRNLDDRDDYNDTKSGVPSSNAHIGKDEYRNVNSEDLKFRDSNVVMEQKTKGLREGLSANTERGHRSPSSASTECKYLNRSGVRQNLEIEESGQRTTINAKDFSASEDRLGRESTVEKSILGEFSQADSSFYDGSCQGDASLIPTSPFRAGPDRPFVVSLDDNVRDNSNPQYRRNNDPSFGRGYGNPWRSVPNWTLPGFVPFQHGPTHGGFQAMIPQFPSVFGFRPPMEVNPAGIPCHIPDANRFSGHMRSLGWENMMVGTGPSHFHGWEGNNGVYRDDPHVYSGSDWDRNRHLACSRGWESGSETWKEQNGDLKKDLPSPACKDESVPNQVDDGLIEPAFNMLQDGCNLGSHHENSPKTKSSSFSSPEKVPISSSTIMLEKLPDTSIPSDNTSLFSQNYLSKLDILAELALPELYDRCMCLLDVESNASINADASTDLFFKNGSRARAKYAITLSMCSPFPAIDSCIFLRAVEHYKKRRVELPNGEKVDIISASDKMLVDELVPTPSLENTQFTVSTDDAPANLPISKLDLKIVETLCPSVKEHLEEPDQNLSQKGQDQVFTHSLELVMSGPSGHENQVEPLAGLGEKEDEVAFDRAISGNTEENRNITVIDESKLVSTVHKGGDNMNSKAKITGFVHCANEKLGFGDTLGGPLIFEDGTPKTSDTLIPGSNESESVILSRIHHSPESTH